MSRKKVKKKILILIKNKEYLNKRSSSLVIKEHLDKEYHVDRDCMSYINFVFDPKNKKLVGKIRGRKLEYYDLIYIRTAGTMRDQAFLLVDYCKANGIKIVEDGYGCTNSNSKLVQLGKLTQKGVVVPKTYYFNEWDVSLPNSFYPFVAKDIFGKGGEGVFLVKKRVDLRRALKEIPQKNLIFQKFIPNDHDWRVVIIDGREVYSCKRVRSGNGDFRNNVRLGAREIPASPDKEIKQVAKSATKATGLLISGVDIINYRNENYVIEVNKSPSFTLDTKISNEIPAVAEFIKKCIKK